MQSVGLLWLPHPTASLCTAQNGNDKKKLIFWILIYLRMFNETYALFLKEKCDMVAWEHNQNLQVLLLTTDHSFVR
jgi:hypothetical protein